MGDIISIIPESFKNLKILTPKNALAPVWDQPWPSGSRKWRKPDRRKFNFSKLSGMLGTTPLNGNYIILGYFGVFEVSWGGLRGSYWAFFAHIRDSAATIVRGVPMVF